MRLEDFVTDTQWLPKFDHYWLGQPLVNDVFTWYEHTLLGFAQFQTLLPPPPPTPSPQNPDYVFNFLPWEVSTSGQRLNIYSAEAVTRQEIDWPFQAGPVKVVPYALGELAYWSDDRAGQNLDCAYSQVGVRATLPLWKVDPDVKSDLFNVNGLAHKIFFNAEFAWTDVNKDLSQLPLYEPLDDYSIEDFRRRFVPLTFPFQPGFPPSLQPIPAQFDERSYAIRSAMAGWVTAPSMEIAGDLMALRLDMENRWQTKARPSGRRTDHRLDHARHGSHRFPQGQPGLWFAARSGRLRFSLADRRPFRALVLGCVRLLPGRPEGGHDRGFPRPATAQRRVRGPPLSGRPDP